MFGRRKGAGKTPQEPRPLPADARRLHVRSVGQVQGVGFRWTCQNICITRHLTGWVRNESDGSVELEIQGAAGDVSAFFTDLVGSYRRFPISYRIEEKDDMPLDPTEADFEVRF